MTQEKRIPQADTAPPIVPGVDLVTAHLAAILAKISAVHIQLDGLDEALRGTRDGSQPGVFARLKKLEEGQTQAGGWRQWALGIAASLAALLGGQTLLGWLGLGPYHHK